MTTQIPLWNMTLTADFRKLLKAAGKKSEVSPEVHEFITEICDKKLPSIDLDYAQLNIFHTLGCRAGLMDSEIRFTTNRFLTAVEKLMNSKPDKHRDVPGVDDKPKAQQRGLFDCD